LSATEYKRKLSESHIKISYSLVASLVSPQKYLFTLGAIFSCLGGVLRVAFGSLRKPLRQDKNPALNALEMGLNQLDSL